MQCHSTSALRARGMLRDRRHLDSIEAVGRQVFLARTSSAAQTVKDAMLPLGLFLRVRQARTLILTDLQRSVRFPSSFRTLAKTLLQLALHVQLWLQSFQQSSFQAMRERPEASEGAAPCQQESTHSFAMSL